MLYGLWVRVRLGSVLAGASASLIACGGASAGGTGGRGTSDGAAPPAGTGTNPAHPVPTGGNADAGPGATADAGAGAPADAGPGAATCKRGIASNAAPSVAFARTANAPGIAWWYNWAAQASGGDPSIELVPMIWGSGSLTATISPASKFVLGFNEPNFKAQADLTTAQAATDWPEVERIAGTTAPSAARLVSPAVNFCGSASDPSQCTDPNVTDPYSYLTDFFAACTGCEVDYVAVHWYNCDLPSLKAYIDGSSGSGGLAGFVQFGKPIWLTEFSCDSAHSVADQLAYMQAAIPYLEGNPHVYRYAWFSASAIPNAQLANADGSLTSLGAAYVSLPANCP